MQTKNVYLDFPMDKGQILSHPAPQTECHLNILAPPIILQNRLLIQKLKISIGADGALLSKPDDTNLHGSQMDLHFKKTLFEVE